MYIVGFVFIVVNFMDFNSVIVLVCFLSELNFKVWYRFMDLFIGVIVCFGFGVICLVWLICINSGYFRFYVDYDVGFEICFLNMYLG